MYFLFTEQMKKIQNNTFWCGHWRSKTKQDIINIAVYNLFSRTSGNFYFLLIMTTVIKYCELN